MQDLGEYVASNEVTRYFKSMYSKNYAIKYKIEGDGRLIDGISDYVFIYTYFF